MPSASRAGSPDQLLEPWQVTVLRSQNLGMLRPEKSWRPIVTLEVDGQRKHEIVLGVDGQNPNQREIMLLTPPTQIKLDVWHKSQSKAKSRKRPHHVASTAMALGEAMKKQGKDRYLELRLSGFLRTKKVIAQKRQPCASLLIRLRPPPSAVQDNDDLGMVKSPSDTLVTPVTEEPENAPPWASGVLEEPPPGLRRRKITKGYCIDSGEEWRDRETKARGPWEPSISSDPTNTRQPPSRYPRNSDILSLAIDISVILPSLLPLTYVADNVSVTSGTSLASSTFDTLTYHRELREAEMDSDFDRILGKLLSEWYYTGASLLSVTAVDTTVFGFSPGNLFNVDSFAKRSLIISSVAAAIGLFVDVWFIFAYSGADVRKFHTLAVDIYGSYFFFSLSSRLPLVALIISVLALVGFLCAVAWTAWPTAVLVMCLITGVLVSLQFIVYGFHRLALCLAWMLRGVWLGIFFVGSRLRAVFRRGQAQVPVTVGREPATAPPASMRAVPNSRHTA
ncbi:hypothetical protein BJV77DRAFT_1022843 [Russula vinacea]|nr:hypothetical protein BJV77DRAFT_1022843 [Russula vinacea]